MPIMYRCLGFQDQYSGNYNFSGAPHIVANMPSRKPYRDILSFLHGYECQPSDLGLTGWPLPDEVKDSQGQTWKKFDVAHIASNKQFSAYGRGGVQGGLTQRTYYPSGHPPYKEKYPPSDPNTGVFMLRQTSYIDQMVKAGLFKWGGK